MRLTPNEERAVQAAFDGYVKAPKWESMETAPRDGTEILWTCLDTTTVIKWPEYRECFDEGWWMPLPALPAEGRAP